MLKPVIYKVTTSRL